MRALLKLKPKGKRANNYGYSMIPAKGRHTEQRKLRALHLRTIRRAKQAKVTAKSRMARSLALKKGRGT